MPEHPVPGDKSENTRKLEKTLENARLLRKSKGYAIKLHADWHETLLGPVILAGDNENLHFLAFLNDEKVMVRIIAHLLKILKAEIEPGDTAALIQGKRELDEYFTGARRKFETPIAFNGTSFQVTVWKALLNTPFGDTITYTDLASEIGHPSSFRAAAQACAQNPTAIIVPCHRVINSDGELGGYLGGIERKAQLLDFEKKMVQSSR